MSKSERERRHLANLARIDHVQLVVGRGDRTRIDHEGTVLERARMLEEELASHRATERGLAALDRLLRVAEQDRSRQTRDVVDFIAAVRGHQPLHLMAMRGLDPAIGDDMLAVLDAFRYGRLNLIEAVEGGPERVRRLLDRHSLGTAP